MDTFIDFLAEVLNQLNLFGGFSDIRKKVSNPFLRVLLYILSIMGGILLGVIIALPIYLVIYFLGA